MGYANNALSAALVLFDFMAVIVCEFSQATELGSQHVATPIVITVWKFMLYMEGRSFERLFSGLMKFTFNKMQHTQFYVSRPVSTLAPTTTILLQP